VRPLFHYCCEHSREGIDRDGVLRPGLDGLVWLTDLAPDALPREQLRRALGLTSTIISCDRLQYAYRANPRDAIPYRQAVARGWVSRAWHMAATRSPRRPANWYVARVDVPALPEVAYPGRRT
jgi:hypothetical protein